MKTRLTMMVTMVAACAASQLTAMPTEDETKRAEPVVRKLLAPERAALSSGRKTRSEVAAAAMKLAGKADTEAEKLLMMKGAFTLYVKDGNHEKAVETMKALEAAIPDITQQNVSNMIEAAFLEASKKEDAAQFYALLVEAKQANAKRDAPKVVTHKRPEITEGKKTYGGYTWSYFVKNSGVTITAAVSPIPKGAITIPTTLGGVKVTGIGKSLFENCKEVTSVTIPEGVTHIDYDAFCYCSGLKSVTLPSSLKVVGGGAFGKCAGLTSVEIPEGVTSIGNDAFNGCSGLKNVVIPNSVTHIGERAFLGCQELTSVTIPAKVASIGEGAFVWGDKLKQINLAADNQSFTLVDGVLYKKDMSVLLACLGDTTAVTIPSGVTKIGAFAFRGCTRLKSVTIPEGVTDIGWVAFVNCEGLKSLTLPSSVKVIGPAAFKDCVELDSVTMRGERPDAQNDIFKNCGKLKAIHVPANAKSWAGMKDWFGIPLVFDAK